MNKQTVTLVIRLIIDVDRENFTIHMASPSEEARPEPDPQPEDTEQEFLFDDPDAITIKEAQDILNCSRGTIDQMRSEQQLKTYTRNKQVRLDRKEVEAARKWWSVPKGKV